jgi:hypothetical protein
MAVPSFSGPPAGLSCGGTKAGPPDLDRECLSKEGSMISVLILIALAAMFGIGALFSAATILND